MNKTATLPSSWTGQLTLAPMISMFVGAGGDTSEHVHPAHKVVLGARSVTYGGAEFKTSSIAIPAGVPHSWSSWGAPVVVAFLDARRFLFEDVQNLTVRLDHASLNPSRSKELLDDFFSLPERHLEKRVVLVLDALTKGKSIKDAAREIQLSQSRLTHLLSEKIGTSPSTWRTWVRFREAIDEVASGSSGTSAAHSAGFTDASHFSRSCRKILGVAPSELANGRLKVVRAGISTN